MIEKMMPEGGAGHAGSKVLLCGESLRSGVLLMAVGLRRGLSVLGLVGIGPPPMIDAMK